MLTSFFSKSKPVNTIVVIVYMSLGFIMANFSVSNKGFDVGRTLKLIGVWLLYIFTMFVLNFISQKNELTRRTSFKILLFASFTLAFPNALLNAEIIVTGVFIILAIRRVLSLRSGRHMERKLFDAALCIGFASLVFFWSYIYILVILVALLYYGRSSWRYWIIPFLPFVALSILTICYVLYIEADSSFIIDFIDDNSFDFGQYSQIKLLLPIAFIISFFFWTIGSFLKESAAVSMALRPTYILVLVFALVALLFVVVVPGKNGREWYIFAIPFAIMATSFFENASSKWIAEVLLWIIILLPFAHYFL